MQELPKGWTIHLAITLRDELGVKSLVMEANDAEGVERAIAEAHKIEAERQKRWQTLRSK